VKTNYADQVRRRKQFLKQNSVEPETMPEKRRRPNLWYWFYIGAPLLVFPVFLILVVTNVYPQERLNYENLMIPLAIFVGVYLLVILWALPKIYVRSLQNRSLNSNQSEFDREKEKLKLEDDTRKTIAQIAGGAVFLFGLIFTYNTFVLNREGQISDRFTKAVSQLGDANMAVRLGGLYALERIAKDSAKDHGTVMEILSAYVREKAVKTQDQDAAKSPIKNNKETNFFFAEDHSEDKIPADVRVALTIIGRRIVGQDAADLRIDLRNASLRGIRLINMNFHKVIFDDADLSAANLSASDFTEASIERADLSGGYLYQTDFTNALLDQSNFSRADFSRADLAASGLNDTNFAGAYLKGAKNLSFELLKTAIIDETTQLPDDLKSRQRELQEEYQKSRSPFYQR
jgi:uncharacterized membrane protein YhaH (DUF805 family)